MCNFFNQIILTVFLFLHEKSSGSNLEVPCRGKTNEYPQRKFLWRILFVLRFNPMVSCQVWSVYLTTFTGQA